MAQFSEFAYIYDELNVHYDKDKIISRIKSLIGSSLNVADLCCGTGDVAIALAKAGYRVTGIDVSGDMLNVATQKAASAAARVQFLCEDARKFMFMKKVDVIYSLTDGMNYMLTDIDLKKAFLSVNNALVPGGKFIFDISTEYKYENVLSDRIFTFDFDDEFLSWQNEYDINTKICTMTVTGFVAQKGGLYSRFDETHRQRCYSVNDIKQMLDACGFDLASVYSGYEEAPLKADDERALFVAVKR